MIPNFGDILIETTKNANTPELARAAIHKALKSFWQTIVDTNSLAAFYVSGTQTIGNVTSKVETFAGGFDTTTIIRVPDEATIQTYLAMSNPLLRLANETFAYTLNNSTWMINCKALGILTPMKAKIQADLSIFAKLLVKAMTEKAPTTQKLAMDIVSEYVKYNIQSIEVPVNYTGSGAGTLTGLMTIKFK